MLEGKKASIREEALPSTESAALHVKVRQYGRGNKKKIFEVMGRPVSARETYEACVGLSPGTST